MSRFDEEDGQFYTVDVASIAAGATHAVAGDDIQWPVDVERGFFWGRATTGAGGGTGNVVAHLEFVNTAGAFVRSFSIPLPLDTAAVTQEGPPVPLDIFLSGGRIRIATIDNNDGDTITAVNFFFRRVSVRQTG